LATVSVQHPDPLLEPDPVVAETVQVRAGAGAGDAWPLLAAAMPVEELSVAA